jgi:hypothetical protein
VGNLGKETRAFNLSRLFNFCVLAIFFPMVFGCSKPSNYPITRIAGWKVFKNVNWEAMEISARFKHEDFNLSNRESSLIIKTKIKVNYNENESLEIIKLHVNQRYIKEDIKSVASITINPRWGTTFDNQKFIKKRKKEKINFALIEITPIFSIRPPSENKEPAIFDVLLEEPIRNGEWFRNYYRVKIGEKHIDLGTYQGK